MDGVNHRDGLAECRRRRRAEAPNSRPRERGRPGPLRGRRAPCGNHAIDAATGYFPTQVAQKVEIITPRTRARLVKSLKGVDVFPDYPICDSALLPMMARSSPADLRVVPGASA